MHRLLPSQFDDLVRRSLAEDAGLGDLTTFLLLGAEDPPCRGFLVARQDLILAGADVARRVFELLDQEVRVRPVGQDGDRLLGGELVAEVEGRASTLLAGERTALNFLGRMCGIATWTRRHVEAVGSAGVRLLSTRKTTPGLRALESYAVAVGGGGLHRLGLHDGVLLKDNHVAVAGGVAEAVRRVRARVSPTRLVEVEVEDLAGLEQAVEAGADAVLLDNFGTEDLRRAVALADGRVRLEASGGITLESLPEVAGTGVDAVSLGALTHSAPNADLALDFEPPPPIGQTEPPASAHRPPED